MKVYTKQQVLKWIIHLDQIGRIQLTGGYAASDLMEWLPQPIEITEEEIAKFIINWGVTFMPDDYVGENNDYEVAIELAKDLLSKLKGE